jgi:hypothetical protein
MNRPECASWNIWRGAEVEGTTAVGEETLFIRSLDANVRPEDFENGTELVKAMTRNGRIKRVWFCKEFSNWPMIRAISKHFKTSCLEVTPKQYDNLPRDLKAEFTIYLKINFPLKEGDFVCVGPPFMDESFQIGTGKKVKPEDYASDIKIR